MKNTLISTLALSLLMVGCGGGSSSSPKTSSSSSVVNSVAPSSTATSSTSAVANSQASSLAALATGVFLDGAVANIGYRTATQQGSTNSNGEFNYRPGESVTFFIGNLELPAVLAGAIITPMEIANTTNLSDNQLINILRLLQSLDADGNAANGIEITAAAIAAGAVLDFTVAPETFAQLPAVKELLQAAGSPNKELISAEQARAHFKTTLEFINGPASSSASSVAETSSSANSETVVVTSSSASSETVVASSSAHTSSVDVGSSASSANSSDDVIIVPGSSASSASTSSSNASSAAPAETQTIWNVYNANHHPAANGSVTLADGSATQFTLGNTADYFNAFNGSVNLDTSTAGSLTSGASIANVVNADGVYPKYFTLIAGITGNGDGLRVLELEVAMADSAKAGSRLKTILRNDGTNKGVQLESANNGASANSYGLNMNTFGIYQIAVTLTDATTGSVRVYRDGQLLPAMSLNNVTMRATSAAGDNFLRFGEVSGSAAYKSTIDWMVWTNQGAFSPDDLSGELPADLGCVYGYGGSNNTVTCANPPATSSSSAANSSTTDTGSSSSAASSIDYGNADVRAPKMEGFAAYAGVTGGAGGPVITVTTGTELNAALCGARTKNNPTPVTILVNGTINHANTTAQGCNTQADVIEIKQTANVSIIGVGTNALFDQIGIHVRESSNVIIQNVHVRNVKKSGSPTSNGGDAIGLESKVDRVWIDHNWLEASGGEKDGYDSLLDMKSGVTNVTVSYNKFNDSSRAGLVGFTDSDVNNNITFHHNWYKNIEQRTPLIRNALVHVYNNYWSNESIDHMFHAVNSRAGAKALVESNYFYNVNNPLIASDDSDTPGCWQTNNDNTVLPYIYYSRTVGNGALVVPTVVDGQLQSTCAVTVPYTVQMDAANDVPAIVMANVGTGKIGNGGASSSSSQSSTVVVETSSSAAQSSSSVASSETVASSNSSASSVNSSEQSEASSSAAPGASVFYSEDFSGATASNFYTTYRVNGSGQSLYKKSGGTPVFADGTIGLTGARFTIGEAGKDLDLSKAYRLSFDVVQVSGSGKVQIFVDNASTSGTTIFNQAANTIAAGQRLVVNSSMGTAASFIQIRAESSTTLVLDNLTIEYTDANPSSSAASTSSAANNSSAGNVSSANSSASLSSVASSSSSSAPYIPPSVNLSADCIRLATDASVNWRDTSLKTDQEIVECLSQSLGKPVGYGENAKGGFDPNGNSKLTIITKNSSVSVEQQLLDAITGEAHNWIVFDKVEFAQPHEIGMYRLGCSNPTVQSILGATEAECVNYTQWCANNGVSSANCVAQFFNTAMNKSNNPIRNPVIGSNKTIDGRMSEAYFLFSGFAIGKDSTGTPTQTANSVIMTHLRFKGAGHTEDHYCDPDMIRSTGASKDIWIHKNTFDTTGDSAFDVKVGAHNVTMSFNRLVNVKRAVLHGSSDSHTIDTQITTTMHHNQFVTTDDSYMLLGNTLRRVPLLRHGKTHMFNNVFVNYRKEILSLRVGASAFMEDSVFVVNSALQEKSSVAASLAEINTNYFKDISDGYFRNDRNFLWFGSASCDLDNTTKTALTATNGTVADLSQNYSADSLNMINGWRFEAGQELVDYLSATAGKYGQVPFNSPLSGDRYYVAGLGKVSCQ